MTRPSEKDGSLIIRGIPASLRGRVNAMAELLNMDRDAMVIAWLENETRRLEAIQKELTELKSVSRKHELAKR